MIEAELWQRNEKFVFFKRGKSSMNLEGKKAPAFNLAGNDGKNYSLDEFNGKTVVLFFYPKDSTPG